MKFVKERWNEIRTFTWMRSRAFLPSIPNFSPNWQNPWPVSKAKQLKLPFGATCTYIAHDKGEHPSLMDAAAKTRKRNKYWHGLDLYRSSVWRFINILWKPNHFIVEFEHLWITQRLILYAFLPSRSLNQTNWSSHPPDPDHQRLSRTTMATICSRPTLPRSRKTSARRRNIDVTQNTMRKTRTLLSFKWVTSDGANLSSWKYRWTKGNWATRNGSRGNVSKWWVRCIWIF